MNPATVYLVDDDEIVREAVTLLLETAGYEVKCHACAEDFLADWRPGKTGCLLLDMRMPGMNGMELQEELRRREAHLPIIFLSAFGDVPTTVRAIKGGAVDFLTKPVNGAVLLGRVKAAVAASLEAEREADARRQVQERLERLTRREREILVLAIAGKPNKEIAQELRISHRTIEAHRSRIFIKTGVHSLLELARMVADAGVRIDVPGQITAKNDDL